MQSFECFDSIQKCIRKHKDFVCTYDTEARKVDCHCYTTNDADEKIRSSGFA